MQPASSDPLPPSFPLEILFMILGQIDDPVYLWTVCREVSSPLRKQVEAIFQQTWLHDTSFEWFRPSILSLFNFKGHFTRIVGDAAYYKIKINEPWDRSTTSPGAYDLAELHRFVTTHDELSKSMAFFSQNRTIIRIGTDPNNSIFSDLPIPNIILREEHILRQLKAAVDIHSPSLHPMPTSPPVVVELNYNDIWPPTENTRLEHRVRCDLRVRRAHSLGWYDRITQTNFATAIKDADTRLRKAIHAARLADVEAAFPLEYGTCRGMSMGVQEPGANGWKMWRNAIPGQERWYQHAWVNERHGGATVWFVEEEDAEAWEVERMARGWEKGTAWVPGV